MYCIFCGIREFFFILLDLTGQDRLDHFFLIFRNSHLKRLKLEFFTCVFYFSRVSGFLRVGVRVVVPALRLVTGQLSLCRLRFSYVDYTFYLLYLLRSSSVHLRDHLPIVPPFEVLAIQELNFKT